MEIQIIPEYVLTLTQTGVIRIIVLAILICITVKIAQKIKANRESNARIAKRIKANKESNARQNTKLKAEHDELKAELAKIAVLNKGKNREDLDEETINRIMATRAKFIETEKQLNIRSHTRHSRKPDHILNRIDKLLDIVPIPYDERNARSQKNHDIQ